MTKKRRRPIHLHVMVSEEEQALIQQRMAESGIRNMGAYMRKMALNGYVQMCIRDRAGPASQPDASGQPGTVPLFMEGHPADGAWHQGLYRPGQL